MLKDVCIIAVTEKLKASILPEVSVPWLVVFVRPHELIWACSAARRWLVTLVVQVQ
jgi:hypothetical protein